MRQFRILPQASAFKYPFRLFERNISLLLSEWLAKCYDKYFLGQGEKRKKNRNLRKSTDWGNLELYSHAACCPRLHAKAISQGKEWRPIADTLPVKTIGHQARLIGYKELWELCTSLEQWAMYGGAEVVWWLLRTGLCRSQSRQDTDGGRNQGIHAWKGHVHL